MAGMAAGRTNDAASMRRTPGGGQGVDQPHPVGHRHRRLVLQTVAGPDLADVAGLRQSSSVPVPHHR
jgi:hypothetical protein